MDRRTFFTGAVAGAAAFSAQQASQTRGEMHVTSFAIVEMMGYNEESFGSWQYAATNKGRAMAMLLKLVETPGAVEAFNKLTPNHNN